MYFEIRKGDNTAVGFRLLKTKATAIYRNRVNPLGTLQMAFMFDAKYIHMYRNTSALKVNKQENNYVTDIWKVCGKTKPPWNKEKTNRNTISE